MKAYEIKEAIGPAGLELTTVRPEPEVGHGEVKIRVHATSLNFRDLLVAADRYPAGLKSSVIPLSDGAGEVVAVGPDVSRFQIGDRVAGTFFQNWSSGAISREATAKALGGSVDGMLAEYVVLPERGIIHTPRHLTFEEAATLPCAGVTAWSAVAESGRIRAGETVLLLGTGGVSLFALQFAKMHGAHVIVASSSDDKLKRARELGADTLINYRRTPDWDEEVLKATGGHGVDIVVEVGGGGTLERSIKAVRVGGFIAVIGVVAGGGQVDPRPIISRGIRLQGIYVGSRDQFEAMNRAISQAELRPFVGRTFSFEEAREGYDYLASGAHMGKIVINV
ncbi:NAD(P)-dependent alcohol dehydrogenase [Desulfuromonas sp. TF]|uniref:zinc-dependent alcohol dehydrogenase family protein n=1 Tax=Desulfuromonas sp. TF TaxID=1232410 RepID=UPI000408BB1B|nr:NAD(P)-dependent alcohol dehydrogenase [Desulfuromonas sp. TF]